MYKKNPVFNVTTLSASNKSVAINALKKQKVAVSVIANLDAQIDIILDESTTKADKEKAIALLKNPNTILYTQVSRKSCIALCKKLEKLNFKDWLVSSYFKKSTGTPEYSFLNLKKVDGNEVLFRLATPVVTYVIKNGTRVEFHIQWTYDIPPVYEDSSESGDDSSSSSSSSSDDSSSSSSDDSSSSSSENKHTVSITNNASEIITNIEPLSGEVNDGEDFTATVTFADEKSASDVEIEGGVIEGTTLTVSNVTADTTVTISAKE